MEVLGVEYKQADLVLRYHTSFVEVQELEHTLCITLIELNDAAGSLCRLDHEATVAILPSFAGKF